MMESLFYRFAHRVGKAFEKLSIKVLVSDIKTKDKENIILESCDWIILSVPKN